MRSFRASLELSGRRPDQLVGQGSAGRDQRTIVRTELLEEPVLSGGSGGSGPLRPGELLSPSAVEGVEGLGHDVRGTRSAVSAGVGGMIAGPALCVRHDRSPRGRSEDLTIPFPSFSPQGLTVSNSTHNAGSHKMGYGTTTAGRVTEASQRTVLDSPLPNCTRPWQDLYHAVIQLRWRGFDVRAPWRWICRRWQS